MIKKYRLIIIVFSILVISVLYWHLNYNQKQFIENTSQENIEKTTEIEKKANENSKSIKLEKPPFIKD